MSWASLVSRAGSPHALLSLKMVFVFIQEDGLASLPRSRLQQPGSRQFRPARLRIKHKDNLKKKQGMGRARQVHGPARLTGRAHFIPKPQYLQINSQD